MYCLKLGCTYTVFTNDHGLLKSISYAFVPLSVSLCTLCLHRVEDLQTQTT